MQHDTTLQVMSNGNFNNLNAQPYFFKDSQLLYVRFQPNLEVPSQVPEFENCTLYDCHTKSLNKSAVLYFSGKNVLYNCTFVDGQVIVIDDDIELYNCHNVKIRFESQKAYNIKARGSEISFDGITSSNIQKYTVKMDVEGGSLTMPTYSAMASWSGHIGDAVLSVGDAIYSAIDAVGCTVLAPNMVYLRNTQACTVLLTGTKTLGEVYGLSFSNNEIRSATESGYLNKKSEIRFGAFVNIGNTIQGIYNNGLITMSKGSDAYVVYGNFNGGEVYNG